MQYDPLVEILNVAENSVKHPGKSAAIRNLQCVLKADPGLSKGLQKRMAAVLREVFTEPPAETGQDMSAKLLRLVDKLE